jgi:hypothetical protein
MPNAHESTRATAAQKTRILALVESRGRALDDVLAMAQRYGLGQGDIETLSKVEALRVVEVLLRLPEVNTERLMALLDMLAEEVGLALQKADFPSFAGHAQMVDTIWREYENERARRLSDAA